MLVSELATVEVGHLDLFVPAARSSGVDQGCAAALGLFAEFRGDLADDLIFTLVAFEGVVLHVQQVDDGPEVIASTDWHLDRHGVAAETLLHLADHAVEVGAHAVHLVDEHEAGHRVLVGLAPHGLGLGLHAGHGAEHHHGAVEHAAGAFDFSGEVHVSRGVDEVDVVVLAMTLPLGEDGGGGDGDAALLLFLHPVGRRGAVMHFTDLVLLAGVVENALRHGRLARVDVGDDAEITRFGEVDGHGRIRSGRNGENMMGEKRGRQARTCGARSCEFRVASFELRVSSCELRVSSCEFRVASFELRVSSCEFCNRAKWGFQPSSQLPTANCQSAIPPSLASVPTPRRWSSRSSPAAQSHRERARWGWCLRLR